MTKKPILPGVLTAALLASTAAFAQSDQQTSGDQQPAPQAAQGAPATTWDNKRLDRLERSVERLENTLARMKPTQAPPNLIEPDPEVIALEGRVDDALGRVNDLEAALKHVNGQLDQADIDLEKSRKAEAAARSDAEALQTRVVQLEAKVASLEQAAQTAAAAQAPQSQTLGAQSGAPASSGDPGGDFKAAMQLMRGGEYDGAASGLHGYLDRWPDGPQAAEAHYQLGELAYLHGDYTNAAIEYDMSLKGYPRTGWAPNALEKLAESLEKIHRHRDACGAIGEFGRRYAKEAAATIKARAASFRSGAKCSV